ncbi:MAG: DsbA family protein [Candidatus Nanohaloarchaea archaeon]
MECEFCGEEFDSETRLHVHWGKEHRDELNSHQEEKVKKAERKMEEQSRAERRRRRRIAGWGFAGAVTVVFLAVVGPQLLGTLGSSPKQSFDLSGEPMLGSENASVTVVAFEDFKCPYCQQFTLGPFQKLKQEYIQTGKVKFYFVNYPLPLGPDSYTAAVAGECVLRQSEEQFWKFEQAVYRNQGPETQRWATGDRMMEIARQSTSGLDYSQLRSCIANEETMPEVRQDRQMALSHGIRSTPTVYVNGQQVSNPLNYQLLKSAIEKELE